MHIFFKIKHDNSNYSLMNTNIYVFWIILCSSTLLQLFCLNTPFNVIILMIVQLDQHCQHDRSTWWIAASGVGTCNGERAGTWHRTGKSTDLPCQLHEPLKFHRSYRFLQHLLFPTAQNRQTPPFRRFDFVPETSETMPKETRATRVC